MEDLQGATLRVKLCHIEPWTEAQRAIAAKYNDLLADSELVRPSEISWARHVYHAYTLRADYRDSVQAVLQEEALKPVFTIRCWYTSNRPTRSTAYTNLHSRSRRSLWLRSSLCQCFRN
jgi:dTDP-4-amino-4,6-dideoxygalactose transaminase